jgi:hypothetical protein
VENETYKFDAFLLMYSIDQRKILEPNLKTIDNSPALMVRK